MSKITSIKNTSSLVEIQKLIRRAIGSISFAQIVLRMNIGTRHFWSIESCPKYIFKKAGRTHAKKK